MIRFALFILATLTATHAHAGGYVRTYSHYQQRFVYPQAITVYMVGAPIRSAAELEALKRQDPVYQLGLKLLEANPQALTGESAAIPQDALPQQASQLTASCVRCHGKEKVEGGLDLTAAITPDQLKAIKARMAAGEMPPEKAPEAAEFSNEQAGAVLLETIELLKGTE